MVSSQHMPSAARGLQYKGPFLSNRGLLMPKPCDSHCLMSGKIAETLGTHWRKEDLIVGGWTRFL